MAPPRAEGQPKSRLPIVSPNQVDLRAPRRTLEHEPRTEKVNRIKPLDQQCASSLRYLMFAFEGSIPSSGTNLREILPARTILLAGRLTAHSPSPRQLTRAGAFSSVDERCKDLLGNQSMYLCRRVLNVPKHVLKIDVEGGYVPASGRIEQQAP